MSWSPDPDKECALLPGTISSSGDAALIYSILGSNLSQVNHIANPQGRILDLVFCTDPDNVIVNNSENPLSRMDFPFHEATEFRFAVADHHVIKPNVEAYFYDFKHADESSSIPPFGIEKAADIFANTLSKDEVFRALKKVDVKKVLVQIMFHHLYLEIVQKFYRRLCIIYSTCRCPRTFSQIAGRFLILLRFIKAVPETTLRIIKGSLYCLVCVRLTKDLSGSISNKQHGFRKGRSTTTNLIEFVNDTLKAIQSGSQVDAT